MSEKPSSANAEGIYEPFSITDVPQETFSKGQRFGIRYQQLGEYGGGSKIGVCRETLEPGKQTYPAHYHLLEEEHLLILEGELTLLLGERSYLMKAGDYVCFPAGQKAGHSLVNRSNETCHYLIIGDRNPHDVIVYTDSGRVSVRLTGAGYRQSAEMDYWENIDYHEPRDPEQEP